jgi:hypothetical protein
MDEIVKQAMAKWPNVPHCYGWLALDARGAWRMRDDRAQSLCLRGDKIAHAALIGFINRNYMADDQGRWYFQNGPQRVYVNLEVTPFIARTDPTHGLVLHTGEPIPAIDAVWFTEDGQLVIQCADKITLLDDRDMAQCIALLRLNGKSVGDDAILDWLANGSDARNLTLDYRGKSVAISRIRSDHLANHFGFQRTPQPD